MNRRIAKSAKCEILQSPSTTLEFWLPMPPKETNNIRAHWAVSAKEKNAYLRELYRRQEIKYHVPPVPAAPICPARLEATFYFKNRGHFMDRDNRAARLKRVIDWLVANRYIVGDRDEQLFYEVPKQDVFTGAEPELCSLRLMITPVDSPT